MFFNSQFSSASSMQECLHDMDDLGSPKLPLPSVSKQFFSNFAEVPVPATVPTSLAGRRFIAVPLSLALNIVL